MKMNKQTKKIIEGNPVAFATVDSRNKPNVIAVAFVKVKDGKVIITDNYMSKTKGNLLKNPFVCLAVWDKSWKGYKIIGKAAYYNSGIWLKFVKSMKENRGEPSKGAIVITVKEIRKLG
jgi:predicted pyridoxine 5'-phosphate oxidase superfamily flavin-nucleotide-binding protein